MVLPGLFLLPWIFGFVIGDDAGARVLGYNISIHIFLKSDLSDGFEEQQNG
jgi:hypothetical protein